MVEVSGRVRDEDARGARRWCGLQRGAEIREADAMVVGPDRKDAAAEQLATVAEQRGSGSTASPLMATRRTSRSRKAVST